MTLQAELIILGAIMASIICLRESRSSSTVTVTAAAR
jgi:hypothetical protein